MRAVRDAVRLALLVLAGACGDWPGVSPGSGPPPAPSRIDDRSGRLGSSCGANGVTCFPGLTCATQLPSGMCTRACQDDGECGGGVCTMYWNVGLVCFPTCSSDVQCRSQYACASTGAAQICVPAPGDAG